jgi:hypothetical protein
MDSSERDVWKAEVEEVRSKAAARRERPERKVEGMASASTFT